MDDLAARRALKERLPRAWPAFFERHGNFTAAQVATIPALLDGQNVMLCAPTAGGKTEAVVAPLVERWLPPAPAGEPARGGPRLLYLVPTRALVNDLQARLRHPLQALGVSLGVKTGDGSSFRPDRPPDLLITTPESLDSLLASRAGMLVAVRAIIVDEIHLFDGSPRGDHLRVLLNRVREVRGYAHARGDMPDAAIQYAALSATLPHPEQVAARYFEGARVVRVGGERRIALDWVALAADGSPALRAYLDSFHARGWRKALAFCGSRAEVEAYAAAMRAGSPFGGAVYVHYSNIEPRRRREIEQQFAQAGAAICFTSSTLELGIDIGDIDVVLLIGPPGSSGSFLQRIGRGARRSRSTHVACCYRTPLERLCFEALAPPDAAVPTEQPAAFRPAVAIQQIFSLIKQSPTAALRLAPLARLFDGMLGRDDLLAILAQLARLSYLRPGRPGEWTAGARLNKLVDEQTRAQVSVSIYSNVASAPARLIDIRDQHTHATVARVDAQWFERPVLTLEGRPINVEWSDGEALWVSTYHGPDQPEQFIYRSARQLLSYDLARRLPERLGLPAGAAPFVRAGEGYRWFHWLGDVYGRAALGLLRAHLRAEETREPGLCVDLVDEPRAPPDWSVAQVIAYLEEQYRDYEPLLALGPFQHLLPVELRRRAVVEQFDVAGFLAALARLRPMRAPKDAAQELDALVADEA